MTRVPVVQVMKALMIRSTIRHIRVACVGAGLLAGILCAGLAFLLVDMIVPVAANAGPQQFIRLWSVLPSTKSFVDAVYECGMSKILVFRMTTALGICLWLMGIRVGIQTYKLAFSNERPAFSILFTNFVQSTALCIAIAAIPALYFSDLHLNDLERCESIILHAQVDSIKW